MSEERMARSMTSSETQRNKEGKEDDGDGNSRQPQFLGRSLTKMTPAKKVKRCYGNRDQPPTPENPLKDFVNATIHNCQGMPVYLESRKKKRCSVCSSSSATLYCAFCKDFFCSLTSKVKKKGDGGKFVAYTAEEELKMRHELLYCVEIDHRATNQPIQEEARRSCFHVRHEKAWLRAISKTDREYDDLARVIHQSTGYEATPQRLSKSAVRGGSTASRQRTSSFREFSVPRLRTNVSTGSTSQGSTTATSRGNARGMMSSTAVGSQGSASENF